MSFILHSTRSFDHAIDLSSSISKSLQAKYQLTTSSSTRTPRSSGKNSTVDKPCTIASIIEGRGTSKGHIGLALMNLRQADVELNEFIDSSTYSRLKMKLLIAEPVEVIVAENYLEKPSNAAMVEMIRSSLPDATITKVHRREFCMQSCCALIKYVEQIQNIVFASKALRFLYKDVEKMCLLGKLFGVFSILTSSLPNLFNTSDVGSWSNLEVLNTDPKKVARSSLLAIVDETLTSGGSRLLRSNLLQPSADQDVIEQRLDAVEELVNNPHVVEKLRQLLDNTYYLDHFFNVFVESPHERTLRTADFHVTQLLNDERIDTIEELLDKQFHSDGFVSRKKSSINLRHQRCYAIKEGVSVNLDIARRAYEELLRDIEAQGIFDAILLLCFCVRIALIQSVMQGNYLKSSETSEEELSTHFPGENTRMAFSTSRGFHYVWVCRDAGSVVLPPVFINVVRNRSSITFTSRNLVRYNDRIEQSLSEVMIATDLVIQHIIKETGKSTYLKQVCQLCILAQSGCFIPAKVAILPVFQRIFSRVGHNDSLMRNLSAFALEMDEIACILQYSNDRTLVVIDELARSTSTEEGIGISFAIIEKLLKQKVLFSTFFYHFPPQVVYVNGQEQFCPTHRLHKGAYNGPLYGFELVELSTFPREVIESARTLAHRLHKESADKSCSADPALSLFPASSRGVEFPSDLEYMPSVSSSILNAGIGIYTVQMTTSAMEIPDLNEITHFGELIGTLEFETCKECEINSGIQGTHKLYHVSAMFGRQ
ncbi:unnamed protein product [Angiostrongylus costaricensis]|uniref:DNA_MISMATCH_REPAIR_2 domain-containing protein n=1 Tax=Angiostrongylus costaricensis TaxID=334426 RepID=A0A158PIH3_ANGCS|nr:unnamed protein product [Angiostrongylus costaricensis]